MGDFMHTESFYFTGHAGTKLPAMLWMPENSPTAILQITHGMTEYIGRYESFARTLTAQGIAVAGYDLRGHGQNPGNPHIASFGEGGWDASLQDMHQFFECLAQRFPNVPHAMMGFSLGSFLLREYLEKWPESIHRAIIMGTGNQPGWVLSIMMAIVRSQIRKGGFDNTTKLVRQLSFGAYNQKFRPNRTESDWLCADNRQLDRYIADPLCRKDISAGLFWQLLGSMKRTGRKTACQSWPKDLPVLIISGQDDPVGDMSRGVQAFERQLIHGGMTRVSIQLLPGARHVVLDEVACGASARACTLIVEWLK